jgi:phosphoribosylamine---glycine ligase
MKILAIDTGSNLLDFLMRCQDAGHDTLWYDQPRKRDGSVRMAGRGIVPKLLDFDQIRKRWIGWADLIVAADNTHYLDMLEPFRRIGFPIFAPSKEAAELELDRAAGQKAFANCGIEIIPSKTFHDYDAAIAYVKKEGCAMVSKPSGDADKVMSYVSRSAADLVYMLERWKDNPKCVKDTKEHGFIIQEKKEGCEMAVGGWFGPGGWSKWIYQNFEQKKLMNGDLGVNTGEMGTLSMYVSECKLFDMVLKPITPVLEKLEYVGYVDVSTIIDDKGQPWPLEFTMRPGWPTFHNQMATHEGDPAQWMLDCLNGKDTLHVKENQACISIVLALPDFPYSHFTNKEVSGIPIYYAVDREHVHLSEVMLGEAPVQVADKVATMPCYVSAGDYLLVCTGTGDTITGARKSAYSAIRKIQVPGDAFYRTDIGATQRLRDGIPKIQKHGFAKGFRF